MESRYSEGEDDATASQDVAEAVISVRSFRWRLAEVIAWCNLLTSERENPVGLRSPELQDAVFPQHQSDSHSWMTRPGREAAIARLSAARAALLRRNGRYPASPAGDLGGGKLLLAAPPFSVWDGASQGASAGFVDIDDAPPVDTWVGCVAGDSPNGFYDPYLISWVPPQYIANVDAAIQVNPVDNIAWGAHLDSGMIRRLKAEGLI